VAKLEDSLTAAPAPENLARTRKKAVCFKPSEELRANLIVAAKQRQMTVTDFIISRLEGTATRDRSDMAAINSLHVAGCALRSLAATPGELGADQNAQVMELISEMRSLVSKLAERIG
jgi:hypothetical protein